MYICYNLHTVIKTVTCRVQVFRWGEFRSPTLSSSRIIMGTRLASMTAWTCCWFPAVMLDRNHTASCGSRAQTQFQSTSVSELMTSCKRRAAGWIRSQGVRDGHGPCWDWGAGSRGWEWYWGSNHQPDRREASVWAAGLRCTPVSALIYDTPTHQPHTHTHTSELSYTLNTKHMLI